MASADQVENLNSRVTALESLNMHDWKAEVISLPEKMNKLETVSHRTLADLVRSQDTCVQELEKT